MKNINSSFNKYLLIASVSGAGDLVGSKTDKVSNPWGLPFSEKSLKKEKKRIREVTAISGMVINGLSITITMIYILLHKDVSSQSTFPL